MNDHAYLYANTSDKSIMYDLAAHCALVEVPPVPGGGLKRILSSAPPHPSPAPTSGCSQVAAGSAACSAVQSPTRGVMEFGEADASLGDCCNPSRSCACCTESQSHPQMEKLHI